MEEYTKLLKEYVSFKSISTSKEFLPEIDKTVNWLKSYFEKNNFSVELLKGTTTNPVILASYILPEKAETVLIYGHYDVQPADGWEQAFILQEKNGRLLARGVVDNKGQNLIHIVTVAELIKAGKLKYNVKFLLEGNEETGNADIAGILKNNKEKLKTDYVLISDGEISGDTPLIEASLRGGANLTLTYKTAPNNVHSGLYGGAIPNAAQEIAHFLAKLFTADNVVTIPGFYEDVDAIEQHHKENNKLLAAKEDILKLIGVKKLLTEKDHDFYTQTGLRPTLEITGINTGYIGEGYSNIIPGTAEVRINVRLVASQDPQKFKKIFTEFVKNNTPSYVDYDLQIGDAYPAVKINIDSEKVKEVKELLTKAYNTAPLIRYVGGSIPIVTDFKKVLGVDSLLVSLGNNDCNMHGVDENFRIDLIEKGLAFSKLFFQK